MTKPLYKYLGRAELEDVEHYYVVACAASRKHRDVQNAAYEKYGTKGPLISAIGQDHFPEDVKEELRSLAREVSDMCKKAEKSRPKGIRMETVYRVGREVAYRDGKGFYGMGAMAYGPGAKNY